MQILSTLFASVPLLGASLLGLTAETPAPATVSTPGGSLDSFEPKTDNHIVALDARTGELIWEHVPDTLSDAHFEMHTAGLVAFPHYDGSDRSSPVFFDPATGTALAAFPIEAEASLDRSMVFWPIPPVRLDNGWQLEGFDPGNTKNMNFYAEVDGERRLRWSLRHRDWQHWVASSGNMLFYSKSYLSDNGRICAHRAGDDLPSWVVDLDKIVPGQGTKLHRPIYRVIDGELVVVAQHHLFGFAPETGRLLWRYDLAEELGVQGKKSERDTDVHPDFFGGALSLGVVSREGDLLVVSYELKLLVIDLEEQEVLWHMTPATFPHCPFPLIHGGRIFTTAGEARNLVRLAK